MAERKRNKDGTFRKSPKRKSGGSRSKTKTVVRYREKKNPTKKRRAARRVGTTAKGLFGAVNPVGAAVNTIPLLVGALAAKFAAKKFADGGEDDSNWTWKNYGFALLGGFVVSLAAGAIFKSKKGVAQKVMEGAFMLTAYKVFINEIAAKNDSLDTWFGDDPMVDLPELSSGDIVDEEYVYGDGGYLPINESHRLPMVGDAVVPVDPSLGQLVPVNPTMGAPAMDFSRGYAAAS